MLNVTLTPQQQAELQAGLDRREAETVRRILLDAVEPTVEALLHSKPGQLTVEEFMRLTDQLVEQAASHLPPEWEGLSDYAVSRDGIYENHP